MNEFISMLDDFWTVRSENAGDYVKIKHAADNDMKNFINGFLGWKLIVNSKLIKLEKIPAEAKPFMGIQEFQSPMDYCLLCALLIYLNDMDEGGQFLLSELTEMIEKISAEIIEVDMKKYSDRKSLVRMLKFAQDIYLLKISEGSLYNVENDLEREILYENTGLSIYFTVHHDRDISEYRSYRDFENEEMIYTDSEKGYVRTNRVYRRLVLEPAMYWESNLDADSFYLKNQRNSISNYLNKYLGGRLDIHNGSAFYMADENSLFGNIHPSDGMLSGFVLLICSEIRENYIKLCTEIGNNLVIEKNAFHDFISCCREKYKDGISKEYREYTYEKLIVKVVEYMTKYKMIEVEGDFYILKDGVFKTAGKYPKNFKNGENNDIEEQENGTLDNEQAGLRELLGV